MVMGSDRDMGSTNRGLIVSYMVKLVCHERVVVRRCTTNGSWSESAPRSEGGDPMKGEPRVHHEPERMHEPYSDRVTLRRFIQEIARLNPFTETGVTFKP